MINNEKLHEIPSEIKENINKIEGFYKSGNVINYIEQKQIEQDLENSSHDMFRTKFNDALANMQEFFKKKAYEFRDEVISMYFSDKVALEELRNNSICILTPFGIRNINDDIDILSECTVYIQNILPVGSDKMVIDKGEMVRYRKVYVTA